LFCLDNSGWGVWYEGQKKAKHAEHVHVLRWYEFVRMSVVGDELQGEGKEKANDSRSVGVGVSANVNSKTGAQGGFDLGLVGAEMGKVVTRFPPEPSGYLHIGHAKAALLNSYFATHFKGQMILRFDDTNPSKEKDEYVDAIMLDLKTLGISWNRLTYTSDYFDELQKWAQKLLEIGQGYIDDTPVEKLRDNRFEGIESPGRNNTLEQNMVLWKEMLAGSEIGQKCVLRAKIDMQAKNKVKRTLKGLHSFCFFFYKKNRFCVILLYIVAIQLHITEQAASTRHIRCTTLQSQLWTVWKA
jgi:glutamyl-tRNA synthetase